jgi:hypothetical protein
MLQLTPENVCRLERAHVLLSDHDVEAGAGARRDPFTQLQAACLEQVERVRQSIQTRDDLTRSRRAHSIEGIAASAAVRRDLNTLAVSADRLRQHPAATRSEEVQSILSSVQQCLDFESGRHQPGKVSPSKANNLGASRGTPSAGELAGNKTAKTSAGLRGVRMDEELTQGLLNVHEREEAMGSSLDAISEGLARLRGVAVDIHTEVQVSVRASYSEPSTRVLRARFILNLSHSRVRCRCST